ncbi:MAG: tetratricopeptide repeat protein [Tuberibacillus sp.]
MQNPTVELDILQSLYDEWFEARLKDLDRLEEIKMKIDDAVKHLKGYIFTCPDYWLISLGHDVILEKLNEAAVSLDQLEKFETAGFDGRYQFYYYLFKGTFFLLKGEHQTALKNFQTAGERLKYSPNEIEKAEYYYKIGSIYYHLRKTIDSIHNLLNALTLFKSEPGYERRIAACEMALGLNSVDLHQWEEAEERFYNALNYVNKIEDTSMKTYIYHDLGLLYAEQNMSKAAIHWLTESLSDKTPNHKTIYLITREYFKLGKIIKAEEWLNRGMELVNKQRLTTYIIRFQLLKILYMERDKDNIETTLKNGITYFIKERIWNYVAENAKCLADFYAENGKYKEAVEYYQIMIDAQNKISEMEALK